MYPCAKSKPARIAAGACKGVELALLVLSGIIVAIPVSAGVLAAWVAGLIFDTLRQKRAGETGV